MSLQIITSLPFTLLLLYMKDREAQEIPTPFCLYLEFRLANCEARDEFTNPRENRPNKMAKEIACKGQISRLPGDFPVIHIYL